MAYRYRIFGLNVCSELELPSWPPGGPHWDVSIRRGHVPDLLPNGEVLWGGAFSGERGRCVLRVAGTGSFLIEDGTAITIDAAVARTTPSLLHLLGGTVFAAVLYQRGVLCLHASAVAWQGRTYLVMGPSGAGKSTTASALLAQGAEFVSDDVTAVTRTAEGQFLATPSFPSLRLNRDAHGHMAGRIAARGTIDPADKKFRMHYTGEMAGEPRPIARVCFLEQDDALTQPRAMPIVGQEKLAAIQRSAYRRRMGRILTDPARLADVALALSRTVEVVRLTRPRNVFTADELGALVLG